MTSSHPLEKLEPQRLFALFVTLLIITIALSILFVFWGQTLVHEGAPYGILSFEFAWTLEGLGRVINPWNDHVRQAAIEMTLVDFIYIVAYSTTLAAAAVMIKEKAVMRNNTKVAQVAILAAWFAWFAAICDIIENLSGLKLLIYESSTPWPFIMAAAASIKFILIIDVLLFTLFSCIWLLSTPKKIA